MGQASTRREFTSVIEWRNHGGALHREDGPAVEWKNGSKNGCKEWWVNGQLHREDGPAIEYATGYKEWWLYHLNVTDINHEIILKIQKLLQLKQQYGE